MRDTGLKKLDLDLMKSTFKSFLLAKWSCSTSPSFSRLNEGMESPEAEACRETPENAARSHRSVVSSSSQNHAEMPRLSHNTFLAVLTASHLAISAEDPRQNGEREQGPNSQPDAVPPDPALSGISRGLPCLSHRHNPSSAP